MFLTLFDKEAFHQQDEFNCESMDNDTYEAWVGGLLEVFRVNKLGQFEKLIDFTGEGKDKKEQWKVVELYVPKCEE